MTRTWLRRCRLQPLRLLKTKPAPRSRLRPLRLLKTKPAARSRGMATPSPSSRRRPARPPSSLVPAPRGCRRRCRRAAPADPVPDTGHPSTFAAREGSPLPLGPRHPDGNPAVEQPLRHMAPHGAQLVNGASNGVAPGTLLPGGSSDEDERGRSSYRHR